ncbi:MAG TPA: hypothetical protein VGS57_15435 [Thermoanaerobaculia bacterium]|nr:hypothetical protein [Thermoanaerobaculia bacterium]
MNKPQEKAYDLAAASAMHLTALASAMLVLGASFIHEANPGPFGRGLVAVALIALFASTSFGIRMLYLLTSTLSAIRSDDDEAVPPLTKNPDVRKTSANQHLFFRIAMALLAGFGLVQLFS